MADSLRLVIVTGLSGAGKSQALNFLEDLGYYAVDNLPAALLPAFADLTANWQQPCKRLALCIDARIGEDLQRLPDYLDEVATNTARPDVLFLEAQDDVLIHRYSESRRRHPCTNDGSVEEGIRIERELLEPLRARADLVLDTSELPLSQLRDRIAEMFLQEPQARGPIITVMSFGFKNGLPQEADLVLDVRFLPNPHYDTELRPWTGNEPNVRDYVMCNETAAGFMARAKELLSFLIPHYAAEPKSYITIAVGCTGGRHRSVAVANALMAFLSEQEYDVRVRHRDIC